MSNTSSTSSPPSTRPPGAACVSGGQLDELCASDTLSSLHHRGRLGGAASGLGVRLGFAALCLLVPLLLWQLFAFWQQQIQAHRFDIPFAHTLPKDADLQWSDGNARLGLHTRGVQRIVTPDAVLSLAPGHDHAQVWIEVHKGQLVRVREIVGKVRVQRTGSPAPQ